MKVLSPVPVNIYGSRAIRQPRTVQFRIASNRSLLKRFQHFIETTDWDERYLCHSLIDKVCMGGIMLSALCFTTIILALTIK